MSLVNNMLKDLDQRRKSTDSSGAPVDLVPASDPPRSGLSRFVLFFSLLLIGVAGGTAYILYEDISLESLEGFDVSKALDLIPDSISLPGQEPEREREAAVAANMNQVTVRRVEPASRPAANELNSSVAAAGTATSNSAVTSNTPATLGPLLQEPLLETNPSPDQASGDTLPSGEGGVTLSAQDVIGDSQEAEAVASQPASEAQQAGEQIAATNEEPVADTTPAELAPEPETAAIADLPPAESVKGYAEMTAEEQDMLAVQYALRLIADNKTIEAYTSLEQHIMNNRYAHQSRETYAKLLVNEGEYLAARNLVEAGLALAPNHAGFKKIKARILIANGAISDAVELLSSRAPSIYEDLEYHEILATAQLASRDYKGALISYTDLVRQDRTQGKWWYGFAASQESLGNRQAAKQGYNQAMQQSNLSPNLRRRVQERLLVLGE